MTSDEEYAGILGEAAKYFDAPPDKVNEFLQLMTTKHKLADIPSEWWSENLVPSMVRATPEIKQHILRKAATLQRVQATTTAPVIETQRKEPEHKPKAKPAPLPKDGRRSLEEQFRSWKP